MFKENLLNKSESQETMFEMEKKKANAYLRREAKNQLDPHNVNDGKLDDAIRETIIKMNKLPFLYTTSSCGGHITTRESLLNKYKDRDQSLLRLPPENKARFSSGHIYFNINRDKQSQTFVRELKKIVAKYKEAEIEKMDYMGEYTIMLELGKEGVKRNQRYNMDIKSAEKFYAEENELKKEIGILVDKFLDKLKKQT